LLNLSKKRSLPTGIYRRVVHGSIYFQVAVGKHPNDKPKIINFKTLAEAKLSRKLYERAKEQHGTGLYLLDSRQQADATTALGMLKAYPDETLVAAVSHYIKTVLSLKQGQSITDLAKQFIDAQKVNWKNETLLGNRSNLNKFTARFGNLHPSAIATEDLQTWDAELITAKLGETTRVIRDVIASDP
jgi:hypothetical protein